MTEEISPRRRKRHVFVSYQCKSLNVSGSSRAEPAIAPELRAAYLARFEQLLREKVVLDGDAVAPSNMNRYTANIARSEGTWRASSTVHPTSSMDVDLIVQLTDHGPQPKRPVLEVPTVGETILTYLCKPDRLEVTLGCLEESFRRRAAKHGLRAAQRYYWFQVGRAIAAFSLEALGIFEAWRELSNKWRF